MKQEKGRICETGGFCAGNKKWKDEAILNDVSGDSTDEDDVKGAGRCWLTELKFHVSLDTK